MENMLRGRRRGRREPLLVRHMRKGGPRPPLYLYLLTRGQRSLIPLPPPSLPHPLRTLVETWRTLLVLRHWCMIRSCLMSSLEEEERRKNCQRRENQSKRGVAWYTVRPVWWQNWVWGRGQVRSCLYSTPNRHNLAMKTRRLLSFNPQNQLAV